MSPHKLDFDRDGFVVVREFLSEADLAELRDELDRYMRDVVPTQPDTAAFYQDRSKPETLKQLQHMGCDPFFESYRKRPRWQQLASELIGEESHAQEPEWFNKPPGTDHRTPPHQDNYYFCLRPANVATLWLALDPVDADNGCLRYVAGSHQHDIRPHGRTAILGFSQGITDFDEDDVQREVAMNLQPGDLVAHHGETIHRADANQSASRQRRAFAMVFRGVSCQRDDEAYAQYTESLNTQHTSMGIEAKAK
jgi:phytanoyl-CoA hydroxylase